MLLQESFMTERGGSHVDETPDEERRHREAALDETIEASFPASDPPSSDPNPDDENAVEIAPETPISPARNNT